MPSETGAGRSIQEELLRAMEASGWEQRDRFCVRLAMEEAIVNAITHGNCYDTAKRVRVRCWLAPEVVRIEVHDEGPGFDPAHVPDPTDPEHLECPCGRGLMLMRHFMTRVEHVDRGSTVVLEKRRTAAVAGNALAEGTTPMERGGPSDKPKGKPPSRARRP